MPGRETPARSGSGSPPPPVVLGAVVWLAPNCRLAINKEQTNASPLAASTIKKPSRMAVANAARAVLSNSAVIAAPSGIPASRLVSCCCAAGSIRALGYCSALSAGAGTPGGACAVSAAW